jgi:hypothetical protein
MRGGAPFVRMGCRPEDAGEASPPGGLVTFGHETWPPQISAHAVSLRLQQQIKSILSPRRCRAPFQLGARGRFRYGLRSVNKGACCFLTPRGRETSNETTLFDRTLAFLTRSIKEVSDWRADYGVRGEKRVLAWAGLQRDAVRFGAPDRARGDGECDIPSSRSVVGEPGRRGNLGLALESKRLEGGRSSGHGALFAKLLGRSAHRIQRWGGRQPGRAAAAGLKGEIRARERCSTAER